MDVTPLDASAILSYLQLPPDYSPSPTTAPIFFLTKHIHQLPLHLLHLFSTITTPQERTAVLVIRNRRFNFVQSDPPALRVFPARQQWPELWEAPGDIGRHEQSRDEKEWTRTAFLGGEHKPFVGKLGALLGEYEEQRQMERVRQARHAHQEVFVPKDESTGPGDDQGSLEQDVPESTQAIQELFLRRVRERLIYGQLEWDFYDKLDWDDSWDRHDRDAEDRWFDDDD